MRLNIDYMLKLDANKENFTMKVLWCTHSLAGYKTESRGYNGCGWITSLLKELKEEVNIQIGIAFYYPIQASPEVRDNVKYYPMHEGKISFIQHLKVFNGNYEGWTNLEIKRLSLLKSVIDDFQPDVIHVWGTETEMGLIANQVNIPVILHLQGLLNPYKNALFPPGFSMLDFLTLGSINLLKICKNINSLHYWKYKSEREIRIFSCCSNYFGRTHWDKAVSKLFSPKANYYYCSELLRDDFYGGEVWKKKSEYNCVKIVSTISSPLYKGLDMILKTASLLHRFTNIKFEWNVIGLDNATYVENKVGINAKAVNVNFIGIKTASEIKMIELSSDLYFHPSYIDNSPNSVCEAQILGMPVIAVNVGGVSSLIKDEENGYLIPSNEPHMAVTRILTALHRELKIDFYKEIQQRHNKKDIVYCLLKTYNSLVNF